MTQEPQTIQSRHRFIAIEGPIGVGKTTLACRLAKTFNSQLLLEKAEENPFLERFYQDPAAAALPTQLFFLFQRIQQLKALSQTDLFSPTLIADYLLDKDRLFARNNLNHDELHLYEQVYDNMAIDAPKPDLVIYLQAPVNILMERIRQRGRVEEKIIQMEYIEKINHAYTDFFHYYEASPLLIINASGIDIVNNENDYQQLLSHLPNIQNGRHFFNPKT